MITSPLTAIAVKLRDELDTMIAETIGEICHTADGERAINDCVPVILKAAEERMEN